MSRYEFMTEALEEKELVSFYRKKKPRKSYVYHPVRNLAICLGEIGIKDVMSHRDCSWAGASRHIGKAVKAGFIRRVSRGRYKVVEEEII